MENKKYWQQRYSVLENAQNNKSMQYYAEIEKQMNKAQQRINSKIEAWYGRLAENNNVTMDEARKMLNAKELKEFKWNVQEYIQYGKENSLNQKWMKQLENASAKSHIDRLEALKLDIQQDSEALFGNYSDSLDAHIKEIYSNGYYKSAYEIQKGFNVGYQINGVDDTRLEKLISKPWTTDGNTFSDRVWNSKEQMINQIQTSLSQGCILGGSDDINQLARFSKAVDTSVKTAKYQAKRLIQTESAYFNTEAQKDSFKELDVEEFEFVATLDDKTSDICIEMDTQHFPLSTMEAGVNAPPMHCNCRSTTVPYFDDNFGTRAARGADGKTYTVEKMNYKQWKEKQKQASTKK